LPIQDSTENSTYNCVFGFRQDINDPGSVPESDLYQWMYIGGLDYGEWNTSKSDLQSASNLMIYEGTDNQFTGIEVETTDISEPVDNLQPDSRQETINGPLFTQYPNGSEEGTFGTGLIKNRNPLAEE